MTFTLALTSTGGGLSAATITLLKQSTRHDVRVVALNAGPLPVAGRIADRYAEVPRGDHPDYVARVAAVMMDEKVDLLLPCSDEEALSLARHRAVIEETGARLACADAETLELVSDKPRCFSWLKERGFDVPDWRLCTTAEELGAAYDHFGRKSFAAKPARGRGNRGVYIVRDDMIGRTTSVSGRELHMDAETFFRDHAAALPALLPILVCERLNEPCYDIDVLSWQGKVLRTVPRRRLNPEGMPFLGNVVEADATLSALADKLATALGLSWLYDFDVMTRADGSPVVIEVNPRPSGSMVASVAAGLPLLDDVISLAKGEPLPDWPELRRSTILPMTSLMVLS
jgi:carbamoyl-phosphate synthase large subunit